MLLVLLLVLALFSSYSLSTSSLRAWQKQKGIMKSTTAMHHLEKPFHARGGASSGEEKSTSVLKRLLTSYNTNLEKHPHITKIISSGIVGGLGDILIQLIKNGGSWQTLDLRRLAVFVSVAAFYIAPVINIWFNWLNSIPYPESFNNAKKALVMIVLDQTIGATVITAGFFYAFELAQRMIPPFAGSFSAVAFFSTVLQAGWECTLKNLWKTLVVNWYMWPGKSYFYMVDDLTRLRLLSSTYAMQVINYVNFLYVPISYRVLFSNVASVVWNMFLSNVVNTA